MTTPDIRVDITPHDGKALIECTVCGPVAVTSAHPVIAAKAHFAQAHKIVATYVVPPERQT